MGPLEGIRVMEVADTQSGCVAGMMLADHGAAVTRIDAPGSALSRKTPGFLVWNRGKQSVSLNLDAPAGRDLLLKLLADADVFVETFGPGEAEALGLDPDTVRQRFPRLIHCSITGYDQDGPDWARPGYDGLVQARAGMMLTGPMTNGVPPSWAQGGPRPGPKYMGFPAGSYAAAFFGTLGILTALVVRKQTGRGQHVNSSAHAGIMAMTRRAWAQNAAGPSMGSGRGLGGIWQCGDGEWVWTHTGARGSFDRYLKIFGLERYMAAAPNPIPWGPEVTQELRPKVAAILKTRPRAEWIRLFDENDCPNAAALGPGQAFDDEQAIVAGMVAAVNDPEFGALQEVGVPIKFSLTPGDIRGSAPRPGEHTVPILRDLGIAEAEVARLRSDGVV